jgi:hypothetical protein
MKKKLIIFAGIVLCIILATGGVFAVKSFIIGGIIRPGAIGEIRLTASDSRIQVSGRFMLDSAKAYKNYSYRVEGSNMYIKIYGTLVSSFHRYGVFDIKIDGDFSTITKIYLEDNNEKQLIWEK